MDDQNTIFVYDYNETYVQLDSDASLMAEISEYFTFEAKNARFHPKFKAKVWDGRIRLISQINNTIYKGLIPYIQDFCNDRGYDCIVDQKILEDRQQNKNFNIEHLLKYVEPVFPPHEHQKKAVDHAIKSNRCLLLSSTGSGKSFIIYLIMRHYLSIGLRVLLAVPSTHLVEQMEADFQEYQPSFDIPYTTHKIYAGADKLHPGVFIFYVANGKSYTLKGDTEVKLINSKINTKLARDVTVDDEIDDIWLSSLDINSRII